MSGVDGGSAAVSTRMSSPICRTPVGGTMTMTPDGLFDEDNHELLIVRADDVRAVEGIVHAVARLHTLDPEGLVPICTEDGKVWPCPTESARALRDWARGRE